MALSRIRWACWEGEGPRGTLLRWGITVRLSFSLLSFLLDRLLQYENVDEDSSGEQGLEKLVEGVVPGT